MSTEVITAAQAHESELRAHAERINQTIDLIVSHEDAFKEATLEPSLLIGQEIAKAQAVFGLTVQEAGKLGGRPSTETVSRRDKVSQATPNPLGFSHWLAREIPRLKRPTAIKYATAFQGLGLPVESATPAQIRARIKDLRHQAGKAGEPMPTLASLYAKARPSKEERRAALIEMKTPAEDPEMMLRDAREFFHVWIEKGESLVSRGYLDALDQPGLQKIREFNLWLRDRLKARIK